MSRRSVMPGAEAPAAPAKRSVMPMRVVAATGAALASLAISPQVAGAHGLVGKQDLPIPRWLFAWAAAAVLVVSFLGLAVLWPRPRLQSVVERRRARLPRLL